MIESIDHKPENRIYVCFFLDKFVHMFHNELPDTGRPITVSGYSIPIDIASHDNGVSVSFHTVRIVLDHVHYGFRMKYGVEGESIIV